MQSVSDKLLHASGYLALYLSCSIAYPLASHRIRKIAALLSYSILIEVLQHFIPHRGFSVFDILANALGLLLGLSLSLIFERYLSSRNASNRDEI